MLKACLMATILLIAVMGLPCFGQDIDWGDAPDSYQTLAASNGALHPIIQGMYLGVWADGELDGQPSVTALMDDNTGIPDDEDGVVITSLVTPGSSVNVKVIATMPGFLDTWVDWNLDGDWADPGENVFIAQPLSPGVNYLVMAVPASAATGTTYSRWRYSSAGGLMWYGPGPDGEVEDYRVTIGDPIPPQSPDIDYGDAPDPTYPTLFASDGARHLMDGVLFLGASVDRELDGQPNAAATGDDTSSNDDEDGVIFTTALDLGFVARVTVIASARGFLDAWIDFNSDGDWNDADEQIFTGQPLAAGTNKLGFLVPSTAVTDSTFARFRLSAQGGLPPTGQAPEGEVEDYQVSITIRQTLPPHEGIDTDGDGIPDNEEDACNSNLDRIPDRIQCNVASFKTSRNQCVTLEMPVTQGLTQICFQEVQNRWTLLPLPPNPPSWVSLPFGLLTFKIVNLGVGNCTTVTFHSSGAPQGQVPQTYWKYGPTPSIPFPHWYDFSFNGRTGAEFIDEKTIVLHFCDGERGDSDLTANGEILDPGGPSHIGERRE
ncbi:MAG: GEVED domain-containing protein, partial [Candidatus Neomarinimicrobiota bacterium]